MSEFKARGALTSSYEEDWICTKPDIDPEYKILIATDSQSLCKAILNRSMAAVEKILLGLAELKCKVIWQWILGHTGTPGKEAADIAAK